MPNYHCNQCGRSFSGSSFIDECPNCSSNNFEKVTPKGLQYLKRFWPLLVLIIALIAAGPYLLDMIGGGKSSSDSVYQMDFKTFDKGLEVHVYEWKQQEGNLESEQLASSRAMEVIKSHNLQVKDNMGRDVTLKNARIYPCAKSKNDTLIIEWKKNETYPFRDRDETKQVKYFTLQADEPHEDANCQMPEAPLKITNVNFDASNCLISVSTNKDNSEKAEKVKISVNGKNGPFKNQHRWDANKVAQYNIYAQLADDTIGFQLNGNPVRDCIDCDQAINKNLKQKVVETGNAYGQDPGALKNLSAFKKQIEPGKTRFYLDEQQLGKWADFSNKLKIKYENEGKTFKVANVKAKNCQINSIKFVKKQ